MPTVLLLESARANGSSFAPQLKKRYDVLVTNTGKIAVSLAKEQKPDVFVLDAASMRTSGDRICQTLRSEVDTLPIIHIKQGPPIEEDESVANSLLYLPFTYRKLWNQIERYVQSDQGDIISAGPFRLNIQKSILTAPGGEQKLTPKLAKLMEIFMRRPDQVIDRRTLMNEVWQTDYMGDTRTLDVHIRWIRQAIETNPTKPNYIRTVRGKGYVLKY